MLPPLEQQRITNEFEPGRKLQVGIIEHRLQPLSGNVSGISDFVQVGFEVDIGLNEEDVINWTSLTSVRVTRLRKEKAYSRARPIFRHWVLYNEFSSRI